jgi:hypothetical protein
MSNDYPRCSACKQEKSRSEYYSRGKGSQYLCSECKDCMKLRSRNQRKVDKKVSKVQSETDAIQVLNMAGIPALPGKALAQAWADVVAFGCVLCEVKSSTISSGQFSFAFTHTQRNHRIRGDVIILECKYEDYNTFHVFPSNHPMLYRPDGKIKTAISYTPNRNKAGRKACLTDSMMAEAQDNWQLVHEYLRQISDKLRFGAQLPILLNAA